MNLTKIKAQYMAERKANNKVLVGVMSTFIGDLESNEKRGFKVDSAIIYSLAKKYLANVKEFRETNPSVEQIEKLNIEENWLTSLLPKSLSNERLIELANQFVNLGDFMKHLKSEYAGQYDGKVANQIFNSK
jgi:hypothetical protein